MSDDNRAFFPISDKNREYRKMDPASLLAKSEGWSYSECRPMKALLLIALLLANTIRAEQKLRVIEVRQPESPAWGTNPATITIRNSDRRPREVLINWQCKSLMLGRNWAVDSAETIPARGTRSFTSEYIIPPFPGKVAFWFRIRDAVGETVLWECKKNYEFPFANSRANPLRLPARLQTAFKLPAAEYPRLRMAARGHIVIYFLEGDTYVQGRIEKIAKERDQIYHELAEKINPGFDSQIAVYLFPDADSKFAYTFHHGLGMANGCVLAEIYTEKERIDPYHEVTHIIAGSIGDPPALFNEGLAVWSQEGHRWDGVAADSWAKAFRARGMLWPMEKIFAFDEFGSDASRPSIAYPQGGSIVKFLIDQYGFDKFLMLYRTLKSSADPMENATKFESVFGKNINEIEKAWLASLMNPAIKAASDESIARALAEPR